MITKESPQESKGKRIYEYMQNACGAVIRAELKNPQVTEIIVNPNGEVWVERSGLMERIPNYVMCVHERERVIKIVAREKGDVVDINNPSIASMMPFEHARFQGLMPPAVEAPSFVIRKHSPVVFRLEEYVNNKILTQEQADYLKQAVLDRKNIIVVGGTGSGKTTLSNALLKLVANTPHRVLTIEDTPELQCEAPNKMALYTYDAYTWADALKDSLRLRPDRIIVGEIREGVAAMNLLNAWNTGHNGGVATIHANSALLGLRRIESMISTVSKNVPKDLIGDAVDILVHIKRQGPTRIIDQILTVSGYDEKEKSYITSSEITLS